MIRTFFFILNLFLIYYYQVDVELIVEKRWSHVGETGGRVEGVSGPARDSCQKTTFFRGKKGISPGSGGRCFAHTP